jgi:hypothetical protein
MYVFKNSHYKVIKKKIHKSEQAWQIIGHVVAESYVNKRSAFQTGDLVLKASYYIVERHLSIIKSENYI